MWERNERRSMLEKGESKIQNMRKRSVMHILRECKATRNEMLIDEFLSKEEKRWNVIKKIKYICNMTRKKERKKG